MGISNAEGGESTEQSPSYPKAKRALSKCEETASHHWAHAEMGPIEETLLKESAREVIRNHDNFVFDMDGVIWRGSTPVEGASETLNALRKAGKNVFFASNNSMADASQFQSKFKRLGFGDWDTSCFYTTAFIIAEVVKDLKISGKVLLLGPPSVRKYLNLNKDIQVVELVQKAIHPHDMDNEEIDMDIQAVVMGFDSKFCYYSCAYATILLRTKPDCHFLITNEDINFVSKKHTLPGSGALCQALISASRRRPVVCGKPSTYLADYIIKDHKLDRAKTCMVGDNLQTDILFGAASGFQTLLVESGVHSRANLRQFHLKSSPSPSPCRPADDERACSCESTGRFLCPQHGGLKENKDLVYFNDEKETAKPVVSPFVENDHYICPIPDFVLPSIHTMMEGLMLEA